MTWATNLIVNDSETYSEAMEEGKRIKVLLDSVTTRKEEITRPLNDALKSARELFKPIETNMGDALAIIRGKMTKYHNDEAKKAEIEKQKVAAKVESGYMKPETGMKKIGDIMQPEKTVIGDGAKATMRTVQKWRVIDKAKIPLQFMEPDMVKIKASFRAGNPVEGVEQYEESELAIS